MFAWDDYLQLAEELHESDSTSVTEARERTATSRAYYAAFHRALEHAPKRIKTAQRDKHRKLIDHYKKGYTETERAVGRKLKMLRDNRNAADYDADIGGAGQSVFKAGESIHLCKEICSALADLH